MEGGRSARRGEGGPGDHRAHLPQGARALRERGRRASRSRSGISTGGTRTRPAVARRSREGDQRLGDRRRAGRRPATIVVRAGQQLARFADTRADGTTLSGNWLYIGMYTDAGNLTQRRSPADPSGLGRYPDWAFSWPANRRILYNRCSADAEGRPWDPSRAVGIAWNGQRWTGDVPDITADSPPAAGLGAFMMLPEGVARLFVPGQFVDGPWSEHYEPVGIAGRQPAAPGAQLESRGEAVRDRVRRARHGRRVSDRLHDLPAHRALPLLDEEQSVQHAAAAGVLRRDPRGAGRGERHRQRRSRARVARRAARSKARPW